METVVVTGANGFLGSAVVSCLCKENYFVYAIIHNDSDMLDSINRDNLKIISCDMCNIASLDNEIERKVDIFYHFAWKGSAGALRSDYISQLNNVQECCDAMIVAQKLGCDRFIFASSIMEYEFYKMKELNNHFPMSSFYNVAKITADNMLKILANNINMEYISVIISNVYGPGEKSERMLNTSIRKLLKGIKTEFTPGDQMYDFIYIDDAAMSFVMLGKKGVPGKKYYLGSFNPQPLKNYLITMSKNIDMKNALGLGLVPYTGVSLDYYEEFDLQAIYSDTGFKPQVPFEEGIKKTIDWIGENL